ncbi:MAG: xanthine dehydrogenase family protein molybdopterin-binding subunit, partial [Chloroflexota bacterium]
MSIGQSEYRVDAPSKVSGKAIYPGDIVAENMLHGKVLFSGQPHARMMTMDITAAEAVPGVLMILTAKDVPVNEYGLVIFDQPVLVGLGSDMPHSDVSLWEGDQVALIIAETEEAATTAMGLIEIEWESRPIVDNVYDAFTDKQILHPNHGSNTVAQQKFRKGNMEEGWAQADVIIEGQYQLPYQEHAYLQPEAGVSYIDEAGRIVVEVAGQWTHEDQMQIAHALGLPPERIRIIYPAIGGAFGGREDMSVQIVLALGALKLQERGINRPLRMIWSREESIIGHHKRHPMFATTRWGAKKDGTITAVEATVYLDAGAYNYTSSKVLGNAHLTVSGPYQIPNAYVDSFAVYTSNVPSGAFRGFGAPQGTFVAENQMNKLAAALQMDPVALRLKNALQENMPSVTQTPLPKGISLSQVIKECALQANWSAPMINQKIAGFKSFQSLPIALDAIRRGRGMACAFKNIGYSFGFPERCEATIELRGTNAIEQAILYHAGADVGQGAHTAFQQMAAEAIGIPFDAVSLIASDTATSGDSGSASASRLTWMAGNAIRGAAESALLAWQNEDRPAVGHFRFTPPETEPYDPETGACNPNFTYGYVAETVELAVDIDTGHIHIERVICANDVGKAINPSILQGQIEGAVIQAHGYALTENLQLKAGKILNPRFSTYLIPGILDIPTQVKSVIMEIPDPLGPW